MVVMSQRQVKEAEEQAMQVCLACAQPPRELYKQCILVTFKGQIRAATSCLNPFNSFLLHLGKGSDPHRGLDAAHTALMLHTRPTPESWPPYINRVN